MKSKLILHAILILITTLLYALKPFQSTKPAPHGGILKQTEHYQIEMKTSGSKIYTYLFDKKLKPISNKELSCSIGFLMPENANLFITLKPFGEDGFVSEANILVYQSCKVIFKMPKKSVSALFDNESIIVKISK